MDDTSFDVMCIDLPGSVQHMDELSFGPFTGIVLLTYEHYQVHCMGLVRCVCFRLAH